MAGEFRRGRPRGGLAGRPGGASHLVDTLADSGRKRPPQTRAKRASNQPSCGLCAPGPPPRTAQPAGVHAQGDGCRRKQRCSRRYALTYDARRVSLRVACEGDADLSGTGRAGIDWAGAPVPRDRAGRRRDGARRVRRQPPDGGDSCRIRSRTAGHVDHIQASARRRGPRWPSRRRVVSRGGGRTAVQPRAGRRAAPVARGAGGYQTATGTEPYLALATSVPVRGDRCSFVGGTAFAIQPGTRQAVIMISPRGRARRFASLQAGRALSGIAFDATGQFGHRLLVTAESGGRTTVFGLGCDGRVSTVAAGTTRRKAGSWWRQRPSASSAAISSRKTSERPGVRREPSQPVRHASAVGPARGRGHRRGVRGVRAAGSHRCLPRRPLLPRQQASGRRRHPAAVGGRAGAGPASGPATSWSPPKAARGPSTCAARQRAPSAM